MSESFGDKSRTILSEVSIFIVLLAIRPASVHNWRRKVAEEGRSVVVQRGVKGDRGPVCFLGPVGLPVVACHLLNFALAAN